MCPCFLIFPCIFKGGKLDIQNAGISLVDLSLGDFDISTLQVFLPSSVIYRYVHTAKVDECSFAFSFLKISSRIEA